MNDEEKLLEELKRRNQERKAEERKAAQEMLEREAKEQEEVKKRLEKREEEEKEFFERNQKIEQEAIAKRLEQRELDNLIAAQELLGREKKEQENIKKRLEEREQQEKTQRESQSQPQKSEKFFSSLRPPRGSTEVDTYSTLLPLVAVVGAGASGIIAAHDLLRKNYRVVMIEAYDRMGGRARTIDKLGVPFDHGCQWLHDDLWQKEAPNFGVKVNTRSENKIDYLFVDNKFSRAAAVSLFEFLDKIEECLAEDREDDREIANEIILLELSGIKAKFLEEKKRVLKWDVRNRLNEQISTVVKKTLLSEDFIAQANQSELGELEAEFNSRLTVLVREDIIKKSDERGRKIRLVDYINAQDKEKLKTPELYGKYDLEYDEKKVDEYKKIAKTAAVEKKAKALRAEKEKKVKEEFEKVIDETVEEEMRAMIAAVDEIYLPFSKALKGRFEESTECEYFSVVDLRKEEEDGSDSSVEDSDEEKQVGEMDDSHSSSDEKSNKEDDSSNKEIVDEDENGRGNRIAEGGYGTLIRTCGEKLRANTQLQVYLNTAVEVIDYTGQFVTIGTSSKGEGGHSGKIEKVSAVIVTASTAVIAASLIDFNPAIPEVIEDFRLLPLGSYKKIGIKFASNIFNKYCEASQDFEQPRRIEKYENIEKSKFEREFITYCRDSKNRDYIWKIQMQLPGSCVVVLIASANFARFLDTLEDRKAVEYALDQLRSMLGDKIVNENFIDDSNNYSVTNWSKDTYVRGAYSYTKPGGKGARNRLKKACPADKIFFAGEALWREDYGSAHAALRSGRYAAEQVDLKLKEQARQSKGQTKQGD